MCLCFVSFFPSLSLPLFRSLSLFLHFFLSLLLPAFGWLRPFYVHCLNWIWFWSTTKKIRNFTLMYFSNNEHFVQNQPIWLDTMATIPFLLLKSYEKKDGNALKLIHNYNSLSIEKIWFPLFPFKIAILSRCGNCNFMHILFPKCIFSNSNHTL